MKSQFYAARRARAAAVAALTLTLTSMPMPTPAAGAATAGGFIDPLNQNATISPLATRSLVTGLAHAGARIVAVGQRGQILYSDDQGEHWRQARVPVTVDLTAVSFVDARHGWAVGHDGVVLHSADGGASWQRQYDAVKAGAPGRPLLDVWFENEKHGMAVGGFGLAVCTEDGGATWTDCAAAIANPNGLHLYAIRAIGGELYVAGEQGLLLKRGADGRFAPLASPYKGSFFGLTGNAGTVLAYGLRGNAYASHDGGRSWERAPTGVASTLAAGAALDDGTLVLLSQAGQLLVSRDDGATFEVRALARPQGAAAALPLRGGLLVGGPRGLQVEALEPK